MPPLASPTSRPWPRAYAHGIARNHPFVDSNKRTAFVALELFLALNGHRLSASDADCVMTVLRTAAGDMPEDALAAWVRAHAERSPPAR